MRYMTTHPGNTIFSVGASYYPATVNGLNSPYYQGYLASEDVGASDKSKIDSAIVNNTFYGNPSEAWIKFFWRNNFEIFRTGSETYLLRGW
jgi:hypothetical protein